MLMLRQWPIQKKILCVGLCYRNIFSLRNPLPCIENQDQETKAGCVGKKVKGKIFFFNIEQGHEIWSGSRWKMITIHRKRNLLKQLLLHMMISHDWCLIRIFTIDVSKISYVTSFPPISSTGCVIKWRKLKSESRVKQLTIYWLMSESNETIKLTKTSCTLSA